MTAEKLHDAISLLPADLIAEADTFRRGKPKVIPWKRYAAMAACFAVVLSCSLFAFRLFAPKGAMETAAEAPAAAAPLEPPKREMAVAEEAAPEMPAENGITGSGNLTEDHAMPEAAEPEGYAFYDSTAIRTPWPSGLCIDSKQDLLIRSVEQLAEFLSDTPEIDSGELAFYDENWFAHHDLVLIRQPEEKSEYRHVILMLKQTDDGWQFTIRRDMTPEDNTQDPVLWYIFVGVDKNLIASEEPIRILWEDSGEIYCEYPAMPKE